MSEQVKKEDVINLIENYYSAPESSRKTLLDNIITAIRCMPDTQEDVIYCKDCKHHKEARENTVPDWCSEHHVFVRENEFCSRAERGKGEE